jgi:hypothetical protein
MPFLDAVVTALDSELGPDKYTLEKSLRTSSGEAYSVTIAIGNLRVRFARDRGRVFAEAKGLEGKGWHDVRTLAEHVRGIPTTQRESAESLERSVELLAMFRDAFAEILGPGTRQLRLTCWSGTA